MKTLRQLVIDSGNMPNVGYLVVTRGTGSTDPVWCDLQIDLHGSIIDQYADIILTQINTRYLLTSNSDRLEINYKSDWIKTSTRAFDNSQFCILF